MASDASTYLNGSDVVSPFSIPRTSMVSLTTYRLSMEAIPLGSEEFSVQICLNLLI